MVQGGKLQDQNQDSTWTQLLVTQVQLPTVWGYERTLKLEILAIYQLAILAEQLLLFWLED